MARIGIGLGIGSMPPAPSSSLFIAPEATWDGITASATPTFSELVIDPETPALSWIYADIYDGASLIRTAKKQLSQVDIDGSGPWTLSSITDLPNGTYDTLFYTMDEDELVVTSAVSAAVEITINVSAASPTVVGYQEATYTSGDGTTATFTIPTTGLTAFAGGAAGDVQDGDTLVLIFACSSSGAAPPSVADGTGMTWESLAALFGDDSNDINLRLARCVVSGAPASTITITGTAATANSNAAILVCLRDYTGTFDVTSVTATGNNDDTADPGAITPNTPNALIMAVYAASTNNFSANTYVGAGPSSGWENYHAVRATGGSSRYTLLAVQTQDWTSGEVDPPAIDPGASSATANSWAAYTIAITP